MPSMKGGHPTTNPAFTALCRSSYRAPGTTVGTAACFVSARSSVVAETRTARRPLGPAEPVEDGRRKDKELVNMCVDIVGRWREVGKRAC